MQEQVVLDEDSYNDYNGDVQWLSSSKF